MKLLLRIAVVVGSWVVLILLGVSGVATTVLHILPATGAGGRAVIFVSLITAVISCVFLCSRSVWKIVLSGVVFVLGMQLLIGAIAEHQVIY